MILNALFFEFCIYYLIVIYKRKIYSIVNFKMVKGFIKKTLKVTVPKGAKAKAVEKLRVKNVKKICKSVINSTAEKKFAMQNFIADKVEVTGCGLNYNGSSQLNGWCSGPSNGFGILPAIPAGSGEGSRTGVKVSAKSAFLRYSILAQTTTDALISPASLNTNPYKGIPFRVRVIVFRHRFSIDGFQQNNICNVGNGCADLGSDLDTYMRPYNKDEFIIVYSKTHRMSSLRHNTGANGATVTTENMPSGTKHFVVGRAKLPLPKTLRYNDQVVTNYPTNINYFLAFAVVNEDGSVVSTTQKRITVSAESGLYYQDM